MKKLFLMLLWVCACSVGVAQVKIGDNPATINNNSLLELETTDKGLLLPRVALTGTTAAAPLGAHVTGMTVFNTATVSDVTPGMYYNSGTQWVRLEGITDGWKTTGNLGTTPGTNFLGTTDAQDLVIKTSNLERMRVTAAGNIGIGLSTPSAPLQFGNILANRKIVLWGNNNDHQFYGFGINPGELRYQVSNNADHVFHVSTTSTASNEILRLEGPTLLTDAAGNIRFGTGHLITNAANGGFVMNCGPSGLASSGFYFRSNNTIGDPTTYTDLVRITADGDVGIGTAAPSAPLDLAVTSGRAMEFDNGNSMITIHDGTGHFNLKSGVNESHQIVTNTGGSHIRLNETGGILLSIDETTAVGGAYSSTAYYKLDNDRHSFIGGNIGVETEVPTRSVDIRGSGMAIIHNNPAWNVWLQGGTAASGDARNLALLGQVSNDILHVGFGGEFDYVRLGPSNTAQVYAGGYKPIAASAFNVASDRRLKENIRPLNNYRDVLKIEPKRFDWKDKELMPVATNDIGIIAQDVQQYFPEFTFESELIDSLSNKNFEYVSVDYSKLVVPVLGVVQDHEQNIVDLQNENATLRDEIKLLLQRLEALEQAIKEE